MLKKVIVFGSFYCSMVLSFDSLPLEIVKKIIAFEPRFLVLSAVNKASRNICIACAQDHDDLFLTDSENGYTPFCVKFILQHNKKITDSKVGEAVLSLVSTMIKVKAHSTNEHCAAFLNSRLKAIASVKPWAVQRYAYEHKSNSLCSLYGFIAILIGNDFLMPLVYVDSKPVPILHYLIGYLPDSSIPRNKSISDTFDVLLKKNHNPFFLHEHNTVLDFIKKKKSYGAKAFNHYSFLLQEKCWSYRKIPNDPFVVIYHHGKPLTIEAIKKQMHDE